MSESRFGSVKTTAQYTPCFCEENVHKLITQIQQSNLVSDKERLFVIFISSSSKSTPIWCQQSCSDPDGCVCWDYHVVLCLKRYDNGNTATETAQLPLTEEDLIFDLDSTLQFPMPLSDYIDHSFRPEYNLGKKYSQ